MERVATGEPLFLYEDPQSIYRPVIRIEKNLGQRDQLCCPVPSIRAMLQVQETIMLTRICPIFRTHGQ